MANAAETMLARIRSLMANPPSAEIFRPEMEQAARAAQRSAAVRKTPVRATVTVSPQTAMLRFSGPGAQHADAVARQRLARSIPEAQGRARANIVNRLGG